MSSSTIIGNVGREPDLRFSNSGMAVCRFSVAVNRRKKDGDDWKDVTTWHDVTCFGPLAENVAETIAKGDEIIAEGYVEEPRLYEKKDGSTGVSLPFVANNLGASLRWKSLGGAGAPKAPKPKVETYSTEPF
jgi:single-strand DNA-binding protein